MGGLVVTGLASEARAADDGVAQIEGLVKTLLAAWNATDAQAYADHFWPDASWVNVVGMHWRGREQVAFAHKTFLATIFKDCKQTLVSIEARAVAPGVALAVVTMIQDAYTTPDGNSMPQAHDRLSLTAVQRDGRWLLIHGHNTIINPHAANNDPVLRMPR
ncbi:SgcJ/EcaC family oxidoreductase [Caulobacter sp.]